SQIQLIAIQLCKTKTKSRSHQTITLSKSTMNGRKKNTARTIWLLVSNRIQHDRQKLCAKHFLRHLIKTKCKRQTRNNDQSQRIVAENRFWLTEAATSATVLYAKALT